MIALVEGAVRQKTPNEIALNILLAGLTIVFLLATVTLQALRDLRQYAGFGRDPGFASGLPDSDDDRRACFRRSASPAWTASFSETCWRCRAARSKPRATCDVLLLDKTGTITIGNRMATRVRPGQGVTETEIAEAALLASSADLTPEGRSDRDARRARWASRRSAPTDARSVPFTAETRMSGIDYRRHLDPQRRDGRHSQLAESDRRASRSRRDVEDGGRTKSPARAARRWWSPRTARPWA